MGKLRTHTFGSSSAPSRCNISGHHLWWWLLTDGMMVRHQRVIKLADQALQQSNQEELRLLAQHIIKAQTQEIEVLTSLRARWYPDLPPTGGMSMGGMGMSMDTNQPFLGVG